MPVRLRARDALAAVVPTTTIEAVDQCKCPPSFAPISLKRVLSLVSASAYRHDLPPMDAEGPRELEVVNVTFDGEWTSITFLRWGLGNDDSVSVRSGHTVWAAAVTRQLPTLYAARVTSMIKVCTVQTMRGLP